MTFLRPIWLVLFIPFIWVLIYWRPSSRFLLGVRGVIFLLGILAMSGLAFVKLVDDGLLIVLVDRSYSMSAKHLRREKELIHLLQKKMKPKQRLAIISFGRKAIIEQAPSHEYFGEFLSEIDRNGSNLASALELALSFVVRKQKARLFILSDGRWTGKNPLSLATMAALKKIPIDYQLLARSEVGDLAISDFRASENLLLGETFFLHAKIYSPIAQSVEVEIYRGSALLLRQKFSLHIGTNLLKFRDLVDKAGVYAYLLKVKTEVKDPVEENNRAKLFVAVEGHRPLLHLMPTKDSGFAALLRKSKLKVRSLTPQEVANFSWRLEELSRYSGLIIENVSAQKIGRVGMQKIAAWIEETGAGLLMTGGKNSYGSGGYYRSPLERVMPLSMELRKEHRKLSLAIVVVLDRSGSMSARVASGQTKMELADIAAAHSLDLLTNMDEFGIIAVDTQPHLIFPLEPVRQKAAMKSKILSIASQGGGIFVYTGLKKAVEMLRRARSQSRHIILFADASDAEEPGRYRLLLEEAKNRNITVSVVALGSASDSDARFLKDVAKRGGGRIFFTKRADELPRLFAQDTLIVMKSAFVKEKTPFQFLPTVQSFFKNSFSRPSPLAGYNLCYIRPRAHLLARSMDQYKAPILAAWQIGLGRVLNFTGEVDGFFSGSFVRWPHVEDFLVSLARWIAGTEKREPLGMLFTQHLEGHFNVIEIHLDPDRPHPHFEKLPYIRTITASHHREPQTKTFKMSWADPDRLIARIPIESQQTSISTVHFFRKRAFTFPPVTLPYSPEFQPNALKDSSILDKMAQLTHGKERFDPSSLWSDIPKSLHFFSFLPFLIFFIILLFLIEIFERRTGLFVRKLSSLKRKKLPVLQEKNEVIRGTIIPQREEKKAFILKEKRENLASFISQKKRKKAQKKEDRKEKMEDKKSFYGEKVEEEKGEDLGAILRRASQKAHRHKK